MGDSFDHGKPKTTKLLKSAVVYSALGVQMILGFTIVGQRMESPTHLEENSPNSVDLVILGYISHSEGAD